MPAYMDQEKFYELLGSVEELLRQTTEDRREQANQFYKLLEMQAQAISDSETRAGNLNTMMTHVFEFLNSVKEERVVLAKAIEAALESNRALSGELHKLVEMHARQQEEIQLLRKMYNETLLRVVEIAKGSGSSENKIEIKK